MLIDLWGYLVRSLWMQFKQKTVNNTALSGSPITAAAFLLPFLTITSIFLILQSAQIEIPRFWAYIPFSLCIGSLEIVSGVFLTEQRRHTTALSEIRRAVIAAACILGVAILITGKDNFLFVPITLIYVAQWLITGKIRRISSSLEVLEQYAGTYSGVKLAQRMRDTMEEASAFHHHTEQIHIITLIFLNVQFGSAFISLLLGFQLSWVVMLVLVFSAGIHFLLRYFIRHLLESQNLLHEGVRVSLQCSRYRTATALVIIGISLIAALLISPGWSLYPPGTLADWLSVCGLGEGRSVPFEQPEPVKSPGPEPAGLQELLAGLPQKDPMFRLDIVFRVIGITGLTLIIFLIIKPFLLPSFYRSIKRFHPFTWLFSALKRFIDGVLGTAGEFVRFVRELFTGVDNKEKTQLDAGVFPEFLRRKTYHGRKDRSGTRWYARSSLW